MASLIELDSVEILVVIDNELDPISASPNPGVLQSGNLKDVAFREEAQQPDPDGEPFREAKMENICCGAHGLSLIITGIRGEQKHTILFDTGPEERAFELNAKRLRADLANIERIQLSHWHRDHSGGMLRALSMIDEARRGGGAASSSPVVVDLHPDRPFLRGVKPPSVGMTIALGKDPTFEEIEAAGGEVCKSDQSHAVLDDMFLISGEIPRTTPYENGLKYGVRLQEQHWIDDSLMKDERLLMCKVKGKGIVVFTGCSHAGVVNASRHAFELGGGTSLYAVMGGYHLADAEPTHIQSTVADLKELDAQVLLAGHCTGWRAKFEIQNQMPGRLVPSFVGSKYTI
ncbi:unnamed protein product [Zymoseptoria tritici ST99CH_3D7]|uniref:Metallo-beta-lactamase domain-containing protein n=1 Tax=Zymoseptoria tritici (strain ST99CH_3D7) TaxID=1276538 RepID=A0A1X7RFV1_ZYMT9|nr:unnamed protein product [Zymoseptoria tritici ST99CH_3D7]